MMTLKAKKALYCMNICRAWCCKNLILYYDSNEKDIAEFFKLRKLEYNPVTHQLIAPLKCTWLNNHNKCRLYSWRPYSCREYECETLKKMTIDN